MKNQTSNQKLAINIFTELVRLNIVPYNISKRDFECNPECKRFLKLWLQEGLSENINTSMFGQKIGKSIYLTTNILSDNFQRTL
jgi:hypothetical protein